MLCVNTLSEKAENTSETSSSSRPSSDDPPQEPSLSDETPSDHQNTAENAVDPSEETQKVGGEAAKKEKLVVAFVPDYPPK